MARSSFGFSCLPCRAKCIAMEWRTGRALCVCTPGLCRSPGRSHVSAAIVPVRACVPLPRAAAAMPSAHMSSQEVLRMDRLQKQGSTAKDILRRLRAARARREEPGPSKSAVYTFLAGKTYVRGREEARGRKSRLPARGRRALAVRVGDAPGDRSMARHALLHLRGALATVCVGASRHRWCQ